MSTVNKPLRGRVFFGNTMLLGYNVDTISIIETYKGLQSLHLHGIHKAPGWDDELLREYSGVEGMDAETLRAIKPADWKNYPLLIKVDQLQEGHLGEEGMGWMPIDKVLKFFGHLLRCEGQHMSFKPVPDFEAALKGGSAAIAVAIANNMIKQMRGESILRRILPPIPIK